MTTEKTPITALALLRLAASRGYTFVVIAGDTFVDYRGADAEKAWKAVCDTEEAHAHFRTAEGAKCGWAFLMAPGPGSCDDDETIVDHSCGGVVEEMVEELTAGWGKF